MFIFAEFSLLSLLSHYCPIVLVKKVAQGQIFVPMIYVKLLIFDIKSGSLQAKIYNL